MRMLQRSFRILRWLLDRGGRRKGKHRIPRHFVAFFVGYASSNGFVVDFDDVWREERERKDRRKSYSVVVAASFDRSGERSADEYGRPGPPVCLHFGNIAELVPEWIDIRLDDDPVTPGNPLAMPVTAPWK